MQTQPHVPYTFDVKNLEIKTKSVEATLLPLVTQISALVNFKENILTGSRPRSERALRAALKIGSAVQAAVERFVVVGETIADENPDIQPEMYDSCHEARLAGGAIANLHNTIVEEAGQSAIGIDKTQLVKAARRLLSSVTRVLLLADRVLVKHILRAEDKISYSLVKLENIMNFTEFVKIFTEFGNEMVDLAHRSGDRQNDLKSEKRSAQMWMARSALERLTMLLLTSSKTLLRHPDTLAARQCRDGVFHLIRVSLQLIGVCVTDGVLPFDPSHYASTYGAGGEATNADEPLDVGTQITANVGIRQLTEMLEMVKMMSLIGSGVQERLVSALDALCEMTQDFTDFAYTPHHQREQILDFLEECRFEMSSILHPQQDMYEHMRSEVIEVTVERLNRRLKDLRKQLQVVALDQVAAIFRANEDQTILSSIKTCSMSGDIDGVERFLEKFCEHADHLQEVCRLMHHISMTDALHVFSGHVKRNLRALAPLTFLAGRTLCIHPSSRIARENLEVFCDTWAANVNDLARLAKDMDAAASNRIIAEKQAYMSLPRPGVSPSSVVDSVCSGSGFPKMENAGGGDKSSFFAATASPINLIHSVCCAFPNNTLGNNGYDNNSGAEMYNRIRSGNSTPNAKNSFSSISTITNSSQRTNATRSDADENIACRQLVNKASFGDSGHCSSELSNQQNRMNRSYSSSASPYSLYITQSNNNKSMSYSSPTAGMQLAIEKTKGFLPDNFSDKLKISPAMSYTSSKSANRFEEEVIYALPKKRVSPDVDNTLGSSSAFSKYNRLSNELQRLT